MLQEKRLLQLHRSSRLNGTPINNCNNLLCCELSITIILDQHKLYLQPLLTISYALKSRRIVAEKGPWERGWQNINNAAKQSWFHRHLEMQIISIIILLRTREAIEMHSVFTLCDTCQPWTNKLFLILTVEPKQIPKPPEVPIRKNLTSCAPE